MDENLRKNLQQFSISNVLQKLSDTLGKKATQAVNSETGQRLLYGPKAIQPVTKGLVEGVTNTFRPFANLVGEASYQANRFAFDTPYRKAILNQPLSPEELQQLQKRPDTKLMSQEQLNSRANTIVSGGAATGKALLGAYGFANPANAATNAGISGAIDYGISRLTGKTNEEALRSAGKTAGGSSVFAGINTITSPFQESIATSVLPKAANFIQRGLVKGAVAGAGNAAESAVFTPLTEGRFASPQELITAAATGLGTGIVNESVSTAFKSVRDAVKKSYPKASEQEIETITRQFVRDEAGRFATQGTKTKEVKYASDIRESLGLPKYGDYEAPVGFQAKPLGEKQSQDIQKSVYENLIKQGLTHDEIAAKYPKVVADYLSNKPQNLNVNKLKLNDEQKAQVRSLETNEPRVVLSNGEVIKASDLTTGSKNIVTLEQTKKKIAQQLNSRQAVVSLEQEFNDLKTKGAKPEILQAKMEEIAKQSKIARTEGTDAGRQLQARNILADQLATPMQKVFRLLDTAGVDQGAYTKDAASVDWNNSEQVVNFYRRYVPPKLSDWLDTLRYNSMLSSPNTHINNAFGNLIGSSVVAPIEKSLTGGIDFLHSAVTGSERQHFVGEGSAYVKGYISSAGEAAKNFYSTLAGKSAIKNLDFGNSNYMPLGTEGSTGRLIKSYTLPTRALEAVDQFFTTLTKGGERAALDVKVKNGVNVSDMESEAARKAAYRLFRGELNDKNQGHLLNAVDAVTGLIQQARSSENPIVSNIAKFTLPFVKTPMNILKQGIEYSPAGVLTTWGAKNKTEQFSKTILGTAGMAATAMLATNGSLSWSEPTDQKKKQAYRDAGIQPYSIKVGDKWISYQKLPPAMSFPIAIVAALHDAQSNQTIDQGTMDVVLNTIAKSGKFYSDQSYVKNIGDLVSALQGDPEKAMSFFGNYPQQLVPWRAFLGWATRLTDPYQRQVDPKGSFLEKQTQQLLMTIPFLSGFAPTRNNQFDEPIKQQNPMINAFSPLKISNENADKAEYYKQLKEQSMLDKNIKAAKTMWENGQEPPAGAFDVKAADNPNQDIGISKEQLMADRKAAAQDKVIKDKVAFTGQSIESNGKLYYYEDGQAKTVELNRQLKVPSLTGKKVIDSMRLETFADDIGKRISDISKLVDLKRIDPEKGYNEIMRLDEQRTATRKIKSQLNAKPKVGRRISIKPRTRSRSYVPKQRKMKAIKI